MTILSYLTRQHNTIEVVRKLMPMLHLRATDTKLVQDFYDHPDYPSMLSVSDVLTSFGIENISVRTSIDQLASMPMPCIAPLVLSGNEEYFAIIESVHNDTIFYYNPESWRLETSTFTEFKKKWYSGILMVLNADDATEEKEYVVKRRIEVRKVIFRYLSLALIPIIAVVACFWNIYIEGASAILSSIYLVITIIGLVTSQLLLLYEIDEDSPVIQQVCKARKKINCSAVVTSGGSKIAGVSWSSIGFVYFFGSAILLLTQGLVNPYALYILTVLNALAIPYVFFSIYYQWKIAKQWCLLCLTVLGVLLLQGFIAQFASWYSIETVNGLIVSVLIPLVVSFLIPVAVLVITIPTLKSNKVGKEYQRELQRFKHNPQIFSTILQKQKLFTTSTQGLGITLGNPKAVHKIIKVCNPFCGPCAQAHAPVEELLSSNPDLQVQIIFTASSDEGDPRTEPVRHFMAIQEVYGEESTRKALDDWYLSPEKDYSAFAAKYPMNGVMDKQRQKVNDMSQWCDKEKIAFTPTFIVDGYQLPPAYSVGDLKYLLSREIL